MVDFAGFEMPVRYPEGIIAEHQHCRAEASLFDVSHMGQVLLHGENVLEQLEKLTPSTLKTLLPGQMKNSVLTNAQGGVIDDFIVTRRDKDVLLVLNAGRRDVDLAHLRKQLVNIEITPKFEDWALIALQGPKAAIAVNRLTDNAVQNLYFMNARQLDIQGIECWVSRSGYTGEDGFEISCASDRAEDLARIFLKQPEVKLAGLGARDSLRLEAGLCLYGNDLDEGTTPIEAGIAFVIPKSRRETGGFMGDRVILEQLQKGAKTCRVGLVPEGRAPIRQHVEIKDDQGKTIGEVSSGVFSPTLQKPIAFAYIDSQYSEPGTQVMAHLRGRDIPCEIVKLPFVHGTYYRPPTKEQKEAS